MDFTGVALGSGVNQYMKMDEMARQNKKLEMDKALADQQLERGRMDLEELRAVDDLRKRYSTINQAYARGELDHPEIQGFFKNYNEQKGAWNNGYTMGMGTDAKGNRVLNFMDKDNNVVDTQSLDPKNFNRMMRDAYMTELGTISPRYGFESAKLDIERGKNDILEKHYGRPTFMQDGTGRILAIDQQGNQIGTYGAARPVLSGGSGVRNHFVPLTGGYSYNQATGTYHGPDGKTITDPAALEKITKMGTPGRGTTSIDGPKVKYTTQDGIELQGTQDDIHNWRLENEPTYRAARGGGNNGLSMADPRQPKQGTGLQRPQVAAPAPRGISDSELSVMVKDAARGGETGRAYLQQALQSGELNIRQRQEIEAILQGR